MKDARWLVLETLETFFSALFNPFGLGILSLFLASGSIMLGIGVAIGLRRRYRCLFLYIIPFLASQALVAISGFLIGSGTTELTAKVQITFLVGLAVLCIFILYKCRKALMAAIALSYFNLVYGLLAAFMAGMALTNDWI